MAPFVYFKHVKYTLGFWTEKNSHIRRKEDIPYSCPCKTLHDLTLCSDRCKLLHFRTANNQIPGRSSACDLYHWAQTKPDGSHIGQHDQSFVAACLSLSHSLTERWVVCPRQSRDWDELQPSQLWGTLNSFLLSFKNTEFWGLPPSSRWQSTNL